MECPGSDVFHLLLAGRLAPDHRARVADHAATCRACHDLLDALVTQHGHVQHYGGGALAIGAVIGGRFRIDDIVGVGGMGIVVAASHLELGNRVALKFMRDEMVGSPAIAERFVREARAVVRLRTEHVCRVLDVARLPSGAPYIVMELLEGVDLARTIARQPLPPAIAVDYVMQACTAVAEAHGVGIVHRDLKPANLFVTRRAGGPFVKVLDFGIAKAVLGDHAGLTRTRVMLGSPGYMSPEQLDSPRDVDGRADIWALGVTLYQLLSGRLPFVAPSLTEVAIKIVGEPPDPIEIDPALRAIVFRCLEKSAAHRYPDVATLAADLVPFGGPAAWRIAVAIGQLANQSGGPPAAVDAPIRAPNMAPPGVFATQATVPPREPIAALPRGRAPAPAAVASSRRRRGWLLVILAGVVVGLVAAMVVMLSRASGTTVAQVSERAAGGSGPPASSFDAGQDAGLGAGQDAGIGAGSDAGIGAGDDLAQHHVGVAAAAGTAPAEGAVGPGHRERATAGHAPARPPARVATSRGAPARQPAVDNAGGRATGGRDALGRAAVVHDAGKPSTSEPAAAPTEATAEATAAAPTEARRSTIFVDAGVLRDALTDAELHAGLVQVEAKFVACAAHNQLHDTVQASVTVSPAGKATWVVLEGLGHSSAFESCLSWVVRDAKWPVTRDGGTIKLPLAFP